jgi:hypothetical protein
MVSNKMSAWISKADRIPFNVIPRIEREWSVVIASPSISGQEAAHTRSIETSPQVYQLVVIPNIFICVI